MRSATRDKSRNRYLTRPRRTACRRRLPHPRRRRSLTTMWPGSYLKGVRGNRVQDVINISIEGAFVAVTDWLQLYPGRRLAETVLAAHRNDRSDRLQVQHRR